MPDMAMPGPLFNLVLWVHIGSGTLAAIALYPIQIFGPKGKFHRRMGRLAIVDTWVILISGFLLLLDPLFLVYWRKLAAGLTTMRHDYVNIFANAMDAWIFFVYLDVLLAYLVFTGVGTWARLRGGNRRTGYPVRRVDVLLTVAAIGITGFIGWVGVQSIVTNPGYARITLGSAFFMGILYIIDLNSWRDKGRRIKSWWALHAWKLAVAWAALVYAVFLRWRVKSDAVDGLTAEFALLVITAMTAAIGYYGWHQRRRSSGARRRQAQVNGNGET